MRIHRNSPLHDRMDFPHIPSDDDELIQLEHVEGDSESDSDVTTSDTEDDAVPGLALR